MNDILIYMKCALTPGSLICKIIWILVVELEPLFVFISHRCNLIGSSRIKMHVLDTWHLNRACSRLVKEHIRYWNNWIKLNIVLIPSNRPTVMECPHPICRA